MKLFVVGVGPLPIARSVTPQNSMSEGTWQMIQPLLEEGHTLRAVTLEFGQKNDPVIEYIREPKDISPHFEHQYYPEPLRDSSEAIARKIQISLAAFQPDAVICSGSMVAAWASTKLKHALPVWFDIRGSFLQELQLRMDAPEAPAVFETFALYKSMLLRGDRFGAVSDRHAHLLRGELGMVGRFNPDTLQEDLVSVQPIGIDPDSPRRQPRTGKIRGRLCREGDLVLFSSGGFNTWQDTRMFFETIETVLTHERSAHFVCIGGGIGGHFDEGYRKFEGWVKDSPVRDRIHLEGWVPQEEVILYESEADIGINCDLPVPESLYGCRTRFLSWMARGVAIATTPVSEPSEFLVDREMAIGLPLGDAKGAAEAILSIGRDRARLAALSEKAEQQARGPWSYRESTRHLREWAANPRLAGDNRKWFAENKIGLHREVASLELALDSLFNSDDRRDGRKPWTRVEKVLYRRWPWPDGRRLKSGI
jgi:glycosyltransferase involved in cell wall biosynthesis